ncbi:hypothetical protein E5Q_03395 [Mixia osmundae IAM 14324]|uniref:ATP-dependent RNA helicase n=1 Tax=Mixia osmundae (strain CBS 9802 / IAM 14324 / JCM 22182 / KY 12970) TaxID=764103 RepID=G7E1L3_MIXOS|nr:hypothetical protein E5Q_03395 [Mixia osmundae IAM 14324]
MRSAPAQRKRKQLSAADLPWKRVKTGFVSGAEDEVAGGLLDFEEVDDVQVITELDESGNKHFRFLVAEAEPEKETATPTAKPSSIKKRTKDTKAEQIRHEDDTASTSAQPDDAEPASGTADADQLLREFDFAHLPGYVPQSLHPALAHAMLELGFSKPTPIQRATFDIMLGADAVLKDIMGIAQTGSGKTLAYGLPILDQIFRQNARWPSKEQPRKLTALILLPTRELAMQVKTHLATVITNASSAGIDTKGKGKGPYPFANIVAVVGGISVLKQRRQLAVDRGIDIIVATPGRLWEMIDDDDDLARKIAALDYLVLDEADRMVQAGHFVELDKILDLTRRGNSSSISHDSSAPDVDIADQDKPDDQAFAEQSVRPNGNPRMRTMIFSATLSKDLQVNLSIPHLRNLRAIRKAGGSQGAIDDLLLKIDFRDPDPALINLSSMQGTVDTLQECFVDCMMTEKDLYLYYFLIRYPGRTIVFLSAIDGIRRLQPIFKALRMQVVPLHSGMQQKARLRSLEQFKANKHAILLATDVAARGLDVPLVDHVVHYQIPRSADVYIHRSGRTARAGREGVSLQLCSPDEKVAQRALLRSINKEKALVELPIEHSILETLRDRVDLARKIDSAQHKANKETHDQDWLRKAAKEMEIDIDSEESASDEPSDRGHRGSRIRKARGQAQQLQAELDRLIQQPLRIRGVSAKYLTSGSHAFVDDLLASKNHAAVLGLSASTAVGDVKARSRKEKPPREEAHHA